MTPARERLLVVLALLAVGGGIVLAATQTFASIDVVGVRQPVVVPGQQAAPALAPLGLVALALAGALTIAGRVARIVLGAVLLLLGAGVVALAVPSVLDPGAGATGAVRAATGISDVVPLVGGQHGTGWPLVAVVTGVAAALLGLVIVARSRHWSTGGRRFRPAAPAVRTTDPVGEWDALTRGTDPTADPDDS